jgi:hypothetical protein
MGRSPKSLKCCSYNFRAGSLQTRRGSIGKTGNFSLFEEASVYACVRDLQQKSVRRMQGVPELGKGKEVVAKKGIFREADLHVSQSQVESTSFLGALGRARIRSVQDDF